MQNETDVDDIIGQIRQQADLLMCLFAECSGTEPSATREDSALKYVDMAHEMPPKIGLMFARLVAMQSASPEQLDQVAHLAQQLDNEVEASASHFQKFPRPVQIAHLLLRGCLPTLQTDLMAMGYRPGNP